MDDPRPVGDLQRAAGDLFDGFGPLDGHAVLESEPAIAVDAGLRQPRVEKEPLKNGGALGQRLRHGAEGSTVAGRGMASAEVAEHVRWAERIGRSQAKRLGMDHDDGAGEAALGLVEAFYRWRPGAGDFRKFAISRVLGAVWDYNRRRGVPGGRTNGGRWVDPVEQSSTVGTDAMETWAALSPVLRAMSLLSEREQSLLLTFATDERLEDHAARTRGGAGDKGWESRLRMKALNTLRQVAGLSPAAPACRTERGSARQ